MSLICPQSWGGFSLLTKSFKEVKTVEVTFQWSAFQCLCCPFMRAYPPTRSWRLEEMEGGQEEAEGSRERETDGFEACWNY